MDILIVSGSPRKNGNSEILLTEVMAMLGQAGRTWEFFRLAELDIHPCIGCGTCARTGTCVFTDDMVPLYDKISNCRVVLISSPIYFYGVTGQCKIFIDRCQTLWSRKYVLHQADGKPCRRGYFLSVAATGGKQLFSGAELTARYGLDAMHCSYDGNLLVPGMDDKGAVSGHPEILDQARELGRAIASS